MQTDRREQQNSTLMTDPQQTSIGKNIDENVKSKLDLHLDRWTRIGRKAKDKSFVFQNLHMHLHVDSFKEAFKALDGSKTLGSKKEYGKNLEVHLKDLAKRVRNGSYRPQPKKKALIAKANRKRTKPMAIACFEDKLVDWIVHRILQEVYEPLFIKNSFADRPNKSQHQAVEACYYSLEKDERPHVLKIDFSFVFNTIPHKKLIRILSKRISDRMFKGLIGRFLVGGLIQDNEVEIPDSEGAPQRAIMSSVLANIYLNEVLDQWFLKNYESYNSLIIRYANSGLFFFKKKEDALKFKSELEIRSKKYEFILHKEKTTLLNMSQSGTESLNFLGLTFYWENQGKQRQLKIKTQKEGLHKLITDFDQRIKVNQNQTKLSHLWETAKSKIRGRSV